MALAAFNFTLYLVGCKIDKAGGQIGNQASEPETFFNFQPFLLAHQRIYEHLSEQAQSREEFLRPDRLAFCRMEGNRMINGPASEDGYGQDGSNTPSDPGLFVYVRLGR